VRALCNVCQPENLSEDFNFEDSEETVIMTLKLDVSHTDQFENGRRVEVTRHSGIDDTKLSDLVTTC
jgi:hypothetical protein